MIDTTIVIIMSMIMTVALPANAGNLSGPACMHACQGNMSCCNSKNIKKGFGNRNETVDCRWSGSPVSACMQHIDNSDYRLASHHKVVSGPASMPGVMESLPGDSKKSSLVSEKQMVKQSYQGLHVCQAAVASLL